MTKLEEISPFNLFLILIHAQIGVGIVTLPHKVFMEAGESAWMTIILSGIIIQGFIILFGYLIKQYPTYNLFDIIREHFGGGISLLFRTLYTLYFLSVVVAILVEYVVILKAWMMPITPKWILVTFTLFVSLYAAKEGLTVISRFFFIASFVLVMFLGLSSNAIREVKFTYLFPILKDGFIPIVKGVPTTIHSFQGFEVLLLIYPFVKGNRKSIVKAASYANVFVVFLYTYMVLLSVLVFSSTELSIIPEPVLYLVKSLSFRIFERPDLLFTSMWLVLVVTTLVTLLYLSTVCFDGVIRERKKAQFIYIFAFFSFLFSMFIYGEYKINNYLHLIQPLILLFSIILPLLIVIYSFIIQKFKGVKNK